MSLLRTKTANMLKLCALTAVMTFCLTTALPAQEKTIGFASDQITARELIESIESNSSYIIAVYHENFNVERKIRLPRTQLTVEEGLNALIAGSEHAYVRNGSHILIVPAQKTAARQPGSAIVPEYNTDWQARKIDAPAIPGMRYDTVVSVSYARSDAPFVYSLEEIEIAAPGVSAAGRVPSGLDTFPGSGRPSFALKTNVLYAASTLTPNLSLEIGLSKRGTLDLSGSYNPWNLNGTYEDNDKLVHWLVRTEYRYWFCERFNGHYLGAHGFFSKYNVGGYDVPLLFEKEYRYQGIAYGAGISYGYHWMWSKSWGLELTAGVGVAFLNYRQYDCEKCADLMGTIKKPYFGPTRLGISLVYIIK